MHSRSTLHTDNKVCEVFGVYLAQSIILVLAAAYA